jgi:hypothetical protein
VDLQTRSREQLLVAKETLEVLGLLMLEQHFFVVELAIAIRE